MEASSQDRAIGEGVGGADAAVGGEACTEH